MTNGATSTTRTVRGPGPIRLGGAFMTIAGVIALLAAGLIAAPSHAYAATAKVELGTAATYSVLGATAVTNTTTVAAPTTTLGGDLGLSPNDASSITGFPPGIVGGATHAGDAVSLLAQNDLTAAYGDAASRAPTGGLIGPALVGKTLTAGVYKATTSLDIGGPLTLNGQGDPDAVFIFQIGSTLVTDSASSVIVSNGAQACNVFWQVASSATLGTGSTFKGTIMALASVTVTTGVTVQGQAMARTGAVTLDHNTFSAPGCAATSAAASASASAYRSTAASVSAAARSSSAAAASRTAASRSASLAAVPRPAATPTPSLSGPPGTSLPPTGPSSPPGPLLILGFALIAIGGPLLLLGRLRPHAR